MKLAIIVVHYKGRDLTEACLASLKKTQRPELALKVIVVDNGSSELLNFADNDFVELVKTRTNLGFTGGNNVGIKKALAQGAEWIMLLNNDTLLPTDFFEIFSQIDLKAGIIAPKIYFAPGKEYHYERYQEKDRGRVIWYAGGVIDWQNVYGSHRGVDEVDRSQYDQTATTDFSSGCAMLIKRAVFEKIGLLDEDYFLYLEDLEFCQRAKRAGFKVVFEPRLCLWHVNAGSSSVGGPLQDYFMTRNRLLFGQQYAPFRAKLALMRESLGLWFQGRKWQRKGVEDFYFRRWSQGSWYD